MTQYNAPTVDAESIYDLMVEHSQVSAEANEVAFERMFETEETSLEDRLASAQRELDLATKANSIAFDIADRFMTREFVATFQSYAVSRVNAGASE